MHTPAGQTSPAMLSSGKASVKGLPIDHTVYRRAVFVMMPDALRINVAAAAKFAGGDHDHFADGGSAFARAWRNRSFLLVHVAESGSGPHRWQSVVPAPCARVDDLIQLSNSQPILHRRLRPCSGCSRIAHQYDLWDHSALRMGSGVGTAGSGVIPISRPFPSVLAPDFP